MYQSVYDFSSNPDLAAVDDAMIVTPEAMGGYMASPGGKAAVAAQQEGIEKWNAATSMARGGTAKGGAFDMTLGSPFSIAALMMGGAAAGGAFGGGSGAATSAGGAGAGIDPVTLPASATYLSAPAAAGAGASAGAAAAASKGGLLSRVGGFLKNNKDIVGSVIAGVGDSMAAKDQLNAQKDLLRERNNLTAGNYRGADPGRTYRGLARDTQTQTPTERFPSEVNGGWEYQYDPRVGRIVRVPVQH